MGGSGNGITPPLPALSPGPHGGMQILDLDSSSPDSRPVNRHGINGHAEPQQQTSKGSRPDLIGEADQKDKKAANGLRRISKDENLHMLNGQVDQAAKNRHNMTQGAIDIEKVMAAVTGVTSVPAETSDDHYEDDGEASTAIDIGEAQTIRRQLDGLETMYGEVLKMLGLKKFGRPAMGPQQYNTSEKSNLRRHNKMYGSMSSLPSVSSIGSRHLYKGMYFITS